MGASTHGGQNHTPAAPSATHPQPPLSAQALARALRAVAAEVERDPELARRVGAAIAGDESADASAAQPAPLAPSHGASGSPSPRGARGLGGEATQRVRDEATQDEDTAPKARHRFTPTLITGAAPELGMGVPDPFALRVRLGEEGLRAALEELRLGTLRAMIREHALDPSGRLAGVNDAAKLRAHIFTASAKPRKPSRAAREK